MPRGSNSLPSQTTCLQGMVSILNLPEDLLCVLIEDGWTSSKEKLSMLCKKMRLLILGSPKTLRHIEFLYHSVEKPWFYDNIQCLVMRGTHKSVVFPLNLVGLRLYNRDDLPFESLPSTLASLSHFIIISPTKYRLSPMLEFLSVYSADEYPMKDLPSTITELYLYTAKSLAGLPTRLKTLHVWGLYNNSVDHLPAGLKSLRIGAEFNQSVDNLPPALESLELGPGFNQSIDRLPSTLKSLTLGRRFNQPLDKLPKTLTHLYISAGSFRQPIDMLPKHLEWNICGRTSKRPLS